MLYTVFLCMTFTGRPDLDNCMWMHANKWPTIEQCEADVRYMRQQSGGRWDGWVGFKRHQELKCLTKSDNAWTLPD